jgi:hypothetical protein
MMQPAGLDLKDFIKRNIQMGKDTKISHEQSIINRVHAKIMKRKDYVFDVNGLSAI